jgi:hypothetical protein
VYDPCTGSLEYNPIGDSGVSAIGAGLQYVPSLRTLRYGEGAGSVCGEEAYACVGMSGVWVCSEMCGVVGWMMSGSVGV